MGFSEILGQDRAIRDLRRAWSRQRIPNAYLFLGPAGVGRSLVAHTFARLLSCSSPVGAQTEEAEPCEVCLSCRKFLTGHHLDLTVIAPEKQILKIDQIREIQKMTRYAPQEAAFRVVILEEIEGMNREAANAFLKLLEEPPPRNLFLLLSSNPSQILPTIVSRCQRLHFQPLSRPILLALLTERFGFSHEDALLSASLAEGSLGKALALRHELQGEERLAWFQRLLELRSHPQRSMQALDLAQALHQGSTPLPLLLSLFRTLFRDLLLWKETRVPTEAIINQDILPWLQACSPLFSLSSILRAIRALEDTEAALKRNAAPLLSLEQLFLVLGDL